MGIAELRTAIARTLSPLSGGRPVDPDSIVVSSGSKQSIFNACFTLFGPNDQVLIPAPAWVSYPQIVHLCRAEPILVPGDARVGAQGECPAIWTARAPSSTQGLILCSPCNPTGAVYTAAELKAIAEWARKHEVWVISDEIYRRINYGPGPAASLLDLPDELLERTVIIYGASKAYAMTGWRIGAALAPPHLAKAMAALQSHTTTGANHPAQWAAATAFSDERVERRSSGWWPRSAAGATIWSSGSGARCRGRVRRAARGLLLLLPGGRHSGDRIRSPARSFCEQLMQQEGVALVPGAAFGDDRWVRLSYAVSDRELEQALDRIVRFIQRSRLGPRGLRRPSDMEARIEPLTGALPVDRLALGPGDRHPLRRVQGQPEGRRASPARSSSPMRGLDRGARRQQRRHLRARHRRVAGGRDRVRAAGSGQAHRRPGGAAGHGRPGPASRRSRWTSPLAVTTNRPRASSICGSAPAEQVEAVRVADNFYIEVDQRRTRRVLADRRAARFPSFEGTL